MDAGGAIVNEWTLPAVLVAGVGLGLVFAVAAVGWFLWRLFGARSALMLSEAFENKLSTWLRVAPPPLPPLDPAAGPSPVIWRDQSQPTRDESLS